MINYAYILAPPWNGLSQMMKVQAVNSGIAEVHMFFFSLPTVYETQ